MSMRVLTTFFVLNALVLNGLLWLVPASGGETVLTHTAQALEGRMADDSWNVMDQALGHLRSDPATPVYSALFFEQTQKFQYPPVSLLPFALARNHLPVVSTVFLIATILAVWFLVERVLVPRRASGRFWQRGLLVAAFTLTFYPIVRAYTLGQIQVWITAVFAIGLAAWTAGYRGTAGVAVGAISLIKPHYGLFLVWAALRRERRFAVALAATALTGLVVSLVVFGWIHHVDYVQVLSHLSRHGESFHPNQSVNGLLNRLAALSAPELYDNLESDRFLPPFNIWVYGGTFATSLSILAFALWRRRRPGHESVDFCLMAVCLTMASPVAWEHHYGVLLPVFVVLLAEAHRRPTLLPWIAVAYVLTSNYLHVTRLLAATPFNVVQSYLFAGALITAALLHRALRTSGAAGGDARSATPAG